MADDCLFCRIVRKELPVALVAEDEHSIAFRDINPQAPVHVLVIPTAHIAAVRAAGGPDGERVLGRTLTFAAEVARELGLDTGGYRIVTNTGPDAGQSVDHLHFHVLGGRKLRWPPG